MSSRQRVRNRPSQAPRNILLVRRVLTGDSTVRTLPGRWRHCDIRSPARTNWHSHPLGQTLIVVAGVGRVQKWEGAVQEIKPGDVVWIPPGVKHWHGASPTVGMTHTAFSDVAEGKTVTWMEAVADGQYRK